MFGLFKSQPFRDAQLGELVRSRGYWRGSLPQDGDSVIPLVLAGGRSQPDPRALSLARDLPQISVRLRPAIAEALFEHYQPYAEAVADAEAAPPAAGLPPIASPADVWPHVTPLYAAVIRRDGALIAELGYRVAWDEEHTLGARLRDGELLELCGSVLAP
ncbi:MAG: DUF6985 domain-containing protein [Planctomycetota bacterium]